ncbi:uncharacterized protein F5891DRAFT_1042185 [Suillus fuscotomentosus]|uniref:Uncharacterized protein n=1 Tax=Suillus fuscotomentosus TaxID=1912939 RepID=A0AAD4E3S0_9AGAM|nr:uncharacterized protein F5891DRAFT_1042185 [Suillus fuscotomentosus]KAG1898741.1 hypothetical protein F5891DRAFT_1042185 [Suillus fuscotomentosus]
MHFSFLAVVTLLTASMSVSACGETPCASSTDCCSNYLCIEPPGSHDPPARLSKQRTASTIKVEPAVLVVHRDSESRFCFCLGIMLFVDKFSCCSTNVNVWIYLKMINCA